MAIQKVPGRMIQLDNQANSDVVYFDGTDWVRLEKGEADDVLTVNEDATAPQWGPLCVFPGTQFGYVCGGYMGKSPDDTSGPSVHYGTAIQKFSLTTDGNATNVADLIGVTHSLASASSQTYGYAAGGSEGAPSAVTNRIQKYSFTTDANATDVGDLTGTSGTTSGTQSSI